MKHKIKQIPLFIIAALLVGAKTYIVYRFYFSLSIESIFQEIILLINAFVISMFVFFLAVWMKPNRQRKYIIYTSLIMSLIIFANLLYYRNFTDFVTVPTLFQVNNAGDLGSSVASLFYFTDLFLFLDVLLIVYLSKKDYFTVRSFSNRFKRRLVVVSLAGLALNYTLAEIERPMLFKRGFDREYLVKNVGLFTYHAYDIVLTASTQSKRLFADGTEMNKIDEYVNESVREVQTDSIDLNGIAEGKNIIYIGAESLQSFVIDSELHGEEITPFLNELKEDSYYFDNFYHQTLLGKTSDHEFLLDNSLYPLPNSAVFFTHAQNEYNSLPKIIEEKGYQSYVLHANNESFWNRNTMYDTLGYDEFFDVRSYDVTEENSFGWGLEDKDFFSQSIELMQEFEEPYYAKLITLSNHFPFDMPEEKATLDPFESDSSTLNHYFQTVRYLDESIEQFFDELKASGMYEDSIIIIMGDHYGISSYHNVAMEQYLEMDEPITPFDELQLERVPLFIHIPGHDNHQTISEVAGQIDFKPTILNMLDIENDNDIIFGNDLFSNQRKGFIAMRDGRVVGEEYVYTTDMCYERSTGEETAFENCEPLIEQAHQELEYSDDIIYGDLFRFYDFEQGEIIEEEDDLEEVLGNDTN